MAAGKGDDTSRGSLSADSYGRTPLGDITNKESDRGRRRNAERQEDE